MTRRVWIWLLGVGLCSGVISACAHTNAGGAPRGTHGNERQALSAALDRKPSSAILTSQAKVADDGGLENADAGPRQPARPELDVVPPPLAPKPAPRPQPERIAAAQQGPATLPAPAAPPEEAPLVAALRLFLNGQSGKAYDVLTQYPKENQEFLASLLPLLVRLTQVSVAKMPTDEPGTLADQLDGLSSLLRGRAELVIDKLCFVQVCRGFGDYDTQPKEHVFGPGDHVWVYAEFRNFSTVSERLASGEEGYAIDLKSQLDIRAVRDNTLRRIPIAPERSQSRSPRHDYCVVYDFYLPTDLTPGWYTLCVEVSDMPTRRVAKTRTLDFRLGTGHRP